MNDNELLSAVREQRSKIPMTIPVEQVISRGRVLRARRRIPGLAGVLAITAAAVFAVTALLPSSHSTSHPPGIQLAAWTVVKHADGTVQVTIRELRDPAGLQRRLRADGVPASVIFGNTPNVQPNLCQSYGHGELLGKVVGLPTLPGPRPTIVMTIHPSALPSGVGVQVITNQSNVGVHLVIASQGCTGT